MAAVTQSAVTILRSWEDGSRSGKYTQACRQCVVTLAAQGATTGDIPAALFNLAEIHEAYAFGIVNGGAVSGVDVALDGVLTVNQSTGVLPAATGILTLSYSTGNPANATGVIFLTVYGRPQ